MEELNFYICVIILIILLKNEFLGDTKMQFKKTKKQKAKITESSTDPNAIVTSEYYIGDNVYDELRNRPGVITNIVIYDLMGQQIPHYAVKLKGGSSSIHDASTIRKITAEDLNWL